MSIILGPANALRKCFCACGCSVALALSAISCSSWNNKRSKALCSFECLLAVVTFTVLPLLRPLVSLDFAATVLNVDWNKARALIEDGSLLWAWDIGRNPQRPLIRIFARSLADYVERRPAPKSIPTLESILEEIFPAHGPAITANYISRRCGVDPEHPANLIRAGKLRLARGTTFKLGRNSSPMVDFNSIAQFFDERLLL